MLERAANC